MEEKSYSVQFLCDISEKLKQGKLVTLGSQDNRDIVFVTAGKKFQSYCVFISVSEQVIQLADIEKEPHTLHHIQLLPKDRILLVSARAHCLSFGEGTLNGRIYGMDGTFQQGLHFGDGIEDMQVSPDGTVWGSYHDQGVLRHENVGRSGLAAWNNQGEQIYEYSPCSGSDIIMDCYALNVERNGVSWIYYYSKFQLLKIQDYKIIGYWDMPVEGSHAFAVYQQYALFYGSYEQSDKVFLVELLMGHKAKIIATISLGNIGNVDRVFARGDALFLLSNSKVYKVTVAELLYLF